MIERRGFEIRRRCARGTWETHAIVPIAAQADGGGADEIVAGTGDEGRIARWHANALERETVGPRIGLIVAGHLGSDDAVPMRVQSSRRQQSEPLRAIGRAGRRAG